jgi:hypothetical protein
MGGGLDRNGRGADVNPTFARAVFSGGDFAKEFP